MFGRLVEILLTLLVALSLASCGGSGKRPGSDGPLTVVASIPPVASIARSIGGDMADVQCLTRADANPETFDPGVTDMMRASDANLRLVTGLLPFELALAADPSRPSVDLSDGLDLLYHTHGDDGDDDDDDDGDHHHDHSAADPHIWSSPRRVRAMAARIASAMAEADTIHRARYMANLSRFNERVDSIDSLFATIPGAAFVVWHPSLSYLADDYGFRQITVGSHAKELSAGQLARRLDLARASGAKVFFLQREFDSSQARTAISHLGIPVVTVNPMNADWVAEMKAMADALKNSADTSAQ